MARQNRKLLILLALAIAIVCGGGVAYAGSVSGNDNAAAHNTPSS